MFALNLLAELLTTAVLDWYRGIYRDEKMYFPTHLLGCVSSRVHFLHATYLCLVLLFGFVFCWAFSLIDGTE